MIKALYPKDVCNETKEWDTAHIGSLSKYPVIDLDHRLRQLEKVVMAMSPSAEALEKYPALKEAYEQYKIVERLTVGNDQT